MEIDGIATTRYCGAWIPGLRRSRLSPSASHPGMTTSSYANQEQPN
jgi:hypothetical protein